MEKAQGINQQLEDEEFEEDANVGSTEDLKNCLLETDQHKELEEGVPDETKKVL